MAPSGKTELPCVNPLHPQPKLGWFLHVTVTIINYSLRKPKSRQKDYITSCGSCWIRPGWERLAFSFREWRAPPPPLLRATAARVQDGAVGEQGQSSGSLKGLFCFISFLFHFSQVISTFQNKRIRLLVDFLKGNHLEICQSHCPRGWFR